jgi:hypothetical protein
MPSKGEGLHNACRFRSQKTIPTEEAEEYDRNPTHAKFGDSTILSCRQSLLECILQRASDYRIRYRDQGRLELPWPCCYFWAP